MEDYPQLWTWSDRRTHNPNIKDAPYHAQPRFGKNCEELGEARGDCLHVLPNTDHHEVLVLSPTRAALLPSKHLTQWLGNAHRSAQEWERQVAAHHANLRAVSARTLGASAATVLGELPTTVVEDEALLLTEKQRYEKVERQGRVDVDEADTIQAIEYRVAFKKALTLAIEVAEGGTFFNDAEEL